VTNRRRSGRPTTSELHDARDLFRSLIRDGAKEASFQSLFASFPEVLSTSLPVKLLPSDIVPLGSPGRSEPDFVFYPQSSESPSSFGVIELKRPDHTLVTRPRKNVVALSSTMATAINQCQRYLMDGLGPLFPRHRTVIALGNNEHAFVIAGLSSELGSKILDDSELHQLLKSIPPHFHILPYDVILERFSSGLPKLVHLLVPTILDNVTLLILANWGDEIAETIKIACNQLGLPAVIVSQFGDLLSELQNVSRHLGLVVCESAWVNPGNLGDVRSVMKRLDGQRNSRSAPCLYLSTSGNEPSNTFTQQSITNSQSMLRFPWTQSDIHLGLQKLAESAIQMSEPGKRTYASSIARHDIHTTED
jgi:hypothetical protein